VMVKSWLTRKRKLANSYFLMKLELTYKMSSLY
jgi:hypothetical protein